jgi:Zn-dependent protease with chaperone function
MVGFFSERRLRMLYLAAAVRVSDKQFTRLHAIHTDAVRILDLPFTPELFVVQDASVNAWTLGLDRPFIVLTSGTLDLLDDDELRVVIGHELGHVLSGHALYSSMLFILLRMTGAASWIPFGNVGLATIVHALKEWYRKAEVSSDRAGLLVSQDPAAATRVHMKLAGGSHVHDMDLTAFLAQAEDYEAEGDVREGVIRILNLLATTHPFSALRALEIKRWVESGDYSRILDGNYPRRGDDPTVTFADEVKAAAVSYRDTLNRSTDPFLKVLRDVAGGVADAVRKATR